MGAALRAPAPPIRPAFDNPPGVQYDPRTFDGDMTMRRSGSSHLRFPAAAFLAAVMMLSVLHGILPHRPEQGPCVACQTLSAPALVPIPQASGLPLEPRPFIATPRGDEPMESFAPPLQPLRAPPLSTAA